MSVACAIATLAAALAQSAPTEQRGTIRFVPTPDEALVAERFRLTEHTFAWQSRLQAATDNFEIWEVTFPSPVTTPDETNNTVYCEYFRCLQGGRRPGVIVLHILGGDFPLARLFCNSFAQHGTNALFVKMPYYGPRRDPKSPRRMVSPDPRETVAGMTQAVCDIRHAAAWLSAQPEVDAQKLGIFGISLGGITAALAATAEPRLQDVCLLLAGGDIGRAILEAPETQPIRERWLARGGTRDEFLDILRAVDPLTYAAAARGKRILMLNARNDEVIPRACTESLWKALGQPPIEWYSGGHYSVIWHLPSAMLRTGRFFGEHGSNAATSVEVGK